MISRWNSLKASWSYFSNSCLATFASTALNGSSNNKICASLYTALANPILAFCPPLKLMPFSPMMVFSAFGICLKSCNIHKGRHSRVVSRSEYTRGNTFVINHPIESARFGPVRSGRRTESPDHTQLARYGYSTIPPHRFASMFRNQRINAHVSSRSCCYLVQTAQFGDLVKLLLVVRLAEQDVLLDARREYPGLLAHVKHGAVDN